MAKHLVFNYTFDASAQTVTLDGIFSQKRFLLITETNSNEIIYSFSDPSKGASNVSFDYASSTTTLTLTYDTTSMADTDPLQIFVEADDQYFSPSEAYTDPVSKLRVSNPENLIDTDFEYGLQSTKWETLELSNNIPTFFARNGDLDTGLVSINTQAQSDIVTVVTLEAHGFQRGSPIIMIGTAIISCDGGFVVASVLDSNTFSYKCKAIQPSTASVKETFTQLFPASVYSGTEFKLSNVGGITSDNADPSTLTVNTTDPTNFTNGTSLVMSNTFAKAALNFATDDVITGNSVTSSQSQANNAPAADTSDFAVGGIDTIGFNTRKNSGGLMQNVPDPFFFTEGTTTINTVTDTITFTEAHGFTNGAQVVYACDTTTNTAIGGLATMRGYYVYIVSSTELRLHRIRNSNVAYRVALSSNGVDGGISKSAFLGAAAASKPYRGLMTWTYDRPIINGGAQSQNRFIVCGTASNPNGATYMSDLLHPNDFSENNAFYIRMYASRYPQYFYISSASNSLGSYWGVTGNRNTVESEIFFVPISATNNVNANTFYLPGHGLSTGAGITPTATAGSFPTAVVSGDTYGVAAITSDRISLTNLTTGTTLDLGTSGNAASTDLVYNMGSVVPTANADTISLPNNTFQDGDGVGYSDEGGTPIGGLTDGTTYYVARKTGGRFNLATTPNPVTGTTTFAGTVNNNAGNPSTITITAHGYTNGDAVVYSAASSMPGLVSNTLYYVRAVTSDLVALYYTKADAVADTNRVQLFSPTQSATATLTNYNIVDLTSAPAGATHSLTADFVGAADGIYSVSATAADQVSFNMTSPNQIQPRTFLEKSQTVFTSALNGFYAIDHGFVTEQELVLTLTGTTGITGLTSGNTYYVIAKSKDFFQLATTSANALNDVAVSLTDTASATERDGTVTLQGTTIIGRFAGTGSVSFAAGALFVTGEDTKFSSYFNSGDTFQISVPPTSTTTLITGASGGNVNAFTAAGHGLSDGETVVFTGGTSAPVNITLGDVYFVRTTGTNQPTNNFFVYYTETDATANTNRIPLSTSGVGVSVKSIEDDGEIIERTIAYVNSDTQITFTEALPSTAQTTADYFLRTQLLLRSDGFALHRPYDGGVEIVPSSNPDSQFIRQTRKYFRYQSGKGIQVSFAVNFSPTSQMDTFTRSGTIGTITTRYPHRLTAGTVVAVSGSTNTDTDSIGTETVDITFGTATGQFFVAGTAPADALTIYEDRTYRFDQSDSTNTNYTLRFSTTQDGDNSGGTEYTTGVTINGTAGSAGAYTEIVVAASAPTLYTYVSGFAAAGFEVDTPVDPLNGQKNLWNGNHNVASAPNETTFTVELDGTPSDSAAQGITEYYITGWSGSALRCGLYDDQNGIFFEYDGSEVSVNRRSSVLQLSGYASVEFRSGKVTGTTTRFLSQIAVGDNIVVKGQTHTVTRIDSDILMYISPSYRGVSSTDVILTKVETTRVPQADWNLDVCDGTGHTGFKLDLSKIQMAYIDYSWYGAGKVRFGFKDQNGDVKYVHQFVHGNFKTEAYMRSGNLPARYEVLNIGVPTYVPALAHWGTSVIMDGRFDNDKAYVFNASSNNLTLTSSSGQTVSGKIDYLDYYTQRISSRNYIAGYAILLDAPEGTLNAINQGTLITGAGLPTGTVATDPISRSITPFQPYLPSITSREGGNFFTTAIRSLLLVDKAPTVTAGSSSSYIIGDAAVEQSVTAPIPLISVRLAPSVDTSTPGALGEREILNRMQLLLNQVDILSTHTAEISLVLNGQLNTNSWERVNNPSLSQLLLHESTDFISGGASIFSFRASGGTGTAARVQELTSAVLGEVASLGNSILGGDNVFPDGPDVLTVVASLTEDPSTVSSTNPFVITGRISWSESQA